MLNDKLKSRANLKTPDMLMDGRNIDKLVKVIKTDYRDGAVQKSPND